MNLAAILVLGIALLTVVLAALLKRNFGFKKELLRLRKELEVQDRKLDYQKQHFSDTATYFTSAEVIIIEMLQEIDSALKSEKGDLSENILKIIFEQARNLLQPQRCALFKIDAQKNASSCLYSFGYRDELLQSLGSVLDADNSFLGWSASTGRFLSLDDAEQDSLLSHLIGSDPLKCHYSQPLKVGSQVKAVLCVSQLTQKIDKDIVIRLFSILSNIASVALSNAMLTQELRELSIKDSLTGIYNHSYFHKSLEYSLANLVEKGGVLSLVIVDLDYFKRINDTYGHQTGDVVIRSVSEILNDIQLANYFCGRYGGEEFALTFVGREANQILPIMEDVRKNIARKEFEFRNQRIRLTVSIGVAEAKVNANERIDKAELVKSADEALYKAKSTGRNKIVVA